MRHPKCFTLTKSAWAKEPRSICIPVKCDLPAVMQEICRRVRGLGSRELLTLKISFSAVLGSSLHTCLKDNEPIWFLALYINTDRCSVGKI